MSERAILLWTMIATAVAALGSLGTAGIAFLAADTWRRGLEQQRVDECVLAINDCASAIGRVVSHALLGRNTQWEHYPEAWNTWRNFKSRYEVVRRYRKDGLPDVYDRGENILHSLTAFCRPSERAETDDGTELNRDFGRIKWEVTQALGRAGTAR